jgi:imidazolonepropionase-like amidohydrolase
MTLRKEIECKQTDGRIRHFQNNTNFQTINHFMKNRIALQILLNLFSISSFCQTYITNVTLVDVEKQRLIPGQTVVIKDDIISNIQSSKNIKIAANALIIDGKGKFLMPGLTDAHVHFFQSGGLYTRPDAIDLRKNNPYENEIAWVHNNMEDFLHRYLQAGITSVIDVGSTNNFLELKQTFSTQTNTPTIYMTGPLITSWKPDAYTNLKNNDPFKLVKTVEEATEMVRQELPFFPDFIKIWFITDPDSVESSAKNFMPLFKAIIKEAHSNGLKVAVHATERIAAQLAVENGCDYLVHQIEDEIVSDDFIKLLKVKKTILCPTLIVSEGYVNTLAQKNNFTFYELTRSNPQQIGSLLDLKHLSDTALVANLKKGYSRKGAIRYFAYTDSVRMVNLKKMEDAGIIIVTGTDAGNIGTQHATSFVKELKAMQKSGLSNWQIIQCATINGAKVLGKENIFGSIAVGKKATMILLDSSPIDSLENITKINLVINKGVLIKPDTLIKETPVALVTRQVNAYNTGNIDAFLEPYSDDIELYTYPDKLIYKGKDNMRKDYAQMFKELPNLHCEIKERIIQGNIIIDKESISGIAKTKIEGTAIYHIENNKIKKVFFID